MSKGVYTFQGGTDCLIGLMRDELARNGVDICVGCDAQQIHVTGNGVQGVTADGRFIAARAVVSNANLKGTSCNWWAKSIGAPISWRPPGRCAE